MSKAIIERRSVMAFVQESTPGTAEVLVDADVLAMWVYNASVEPSIENERREELSGGGGGRIASVPGARRAKVAFETDLAGSGVELTPMPPWATTLLPATCWVNAAGNVFTPSLRAPDDADGVTKSLTIGLYEDGRLKQAHGCMGDWEWRFPSGGRARIGWTFEGVWDEPTDAAMPPVVPQVAGPLRFADATVLIGGVWVPRLAELVLRTGNEIIVREDQADVSGLHCATVVDREVGGEMDPEAVLVGGHDHWGQWLNMTEQALSVIIGGVAGNIVTFAAPKMQFNNLGGEVRNKVRTDKTTFQCNRSAGPPDTEGSITFS